MNKLKFDFVDAEADHVVAFDALRTDRGITEPYSHELWSQLRQDAYWPLIEGYLEANRVDTISDYLLDQCDNGTNGFKYFALVSEYLIAKGDKERLIEFWQSIVVSRYRCGPKAVATQALALMREALEKLGDTTAADELQAKLVKNAVKKGKFSTGKQTAMTESEFWDLIEKAKGSGRPSFAQITLRSERLRDLLSELTAAEVQEFAEIFQRKLNDSYSWELWGIGYIAFGGCSDDDFRYFRAWLLSEGKDVYLTLLQEPERIVDLGIKPSKLESILSVPYEVYSDMTGEELSTSKNGLTEPSGVEWEATDEALQARFPKAYAHFSH